MINFVGGYLAWIVAAVGAVAACDLAVDNYVAALLEAASGPNGSPATWPLAACAQADFRASLELASSSSTLLTF